MRVLLTGASGFVGRAAMEALVRHGAEVHAVSRRRPETETPHIWHPADLLDRHSAKNVVEEIRPEAVLHLAWVVEHGTFWTSPLNRDWTEASIALARYAAEAGTKRFVGCGTCYEYDWPSKGDCSEFLTPLKPSTLYSEAKNTTRKSIEALAKETGMSFAWARLFFIYGPGEGENRLVPSLARALNAGDPARCSTGQAVRDFMDVRDAGEALAALTVSRATGGFNIASGEGTAVADIARKLAQFSGRPDLLQIGALPDRPNEPPRIVADVTRLQNELGFKPARSLDEGLRDALRYWAKAGNQAE
jgi:nucleoside-diphosphate-sugar epimerase